LTKPKVKSPRPKKEPEYEKRWCGHRTKCYVWIKCTNEKGYGRKWYRGKTRKAHRVYFEVEHGVELAPHEQLDHLCENESCVRPSHLEVVDNLTNQKRKSTLKITPESVAQIVALKGQQSQQKIADRFGISRRYVRNIHAGLVAEWP
jgi:hypothetical protein